MDQSRSQSGVLYDSREHLAVLQELCGEVQAATAALADLRLDELRDRTVRQSALCFRLEQAVQGLVVCHDADRLHGIADQSAIAELRSRHVQLSGLNRRFVALLRRSRRTSDLLAGHYRAFLDGFGAEQVPRTSQRSWNSEM